MDWARAPRHFAGCEKKLSTCLLDNRDFIYREAFKGGWDAAVGRDDIKFPPKDAQYQPSGTFREWDVYCLSEVGGLHPLAQELTIGMENKTTYVQGEFTSEGKLDGHALLLTVSQIFEIANFKNGERHGYCFLLQVQSKSDGTVDGIAFISQFKDGKLQGESRQYVSWRRPPIIDQYERGFPMTGRTC